MDFSFQLGSKNSSLLTEDLRTSYKNIVCSASMFCIHTVLLLQVFPVNGHVLAGCAEPVFKSFKELSQNRTAAVAR
jgi:hypothetical protein